MHIAYLSTGFNPICINEYATDLKDIWFEKKTNFDVEVRVIHSENTEFVLTISIVWKTIFIMNFTLIVAASQLCFNALAFVVDYKQLSLLNVSNDSDSNLLQLRKWQITFTIATGIRICSTSNTRSAARSTAFTIVKSNLPTTKKKYLAWIVK